MTDMPPRPIALVDDDDDLRAAMAQTLTLAGHDVRAFARAADALAAIDTDFPGVVVSDVRMPHMSGIDLFRALHARDAELPVILVTGHGDVPMAVDAMKEGAVDFIQKPYREEALLEKIEAALEQDQEQRKSLDEKQEIIRRVKSLTPREREIMDRMIAGQANKVIAIELEISQRTVEIHRSRVMHKMGTHSLAHLVRMVLSVKDLID